MKYILATLFALPGYTTMCGAFYSFYLAMLHFVGRDPLEFTFFVFTAYLVFSFGWGWNKAVTKYFGLEH